MCAWVTAADQGASEFLPLLDYATSGATWHLISFYRLHLQIIL